MSDDAVDLQELSQGSEGSDVSGRSRGVALGLCVVGGIFGLHRFYTGRTGTGVGMCLSLGGLGIWYLYDIIVVAVGEFRDSDGRRVVRWEVGEGPPLTGASSGRLAEMERRLQGLEGQLTELAERVDFAERMLAQRRDAGRLPPGERAS